MSEFSIDDLNLSLNCNYGMAVMGNGIAHLLCIRW
jgi:hypothetical protein